MPPIAGLQLICPSVSMLWVRRSVRAPMRAEASAASVPACPPPMTITSNVRANLTFSSLGPSGNRSGKGIVGRCLVRTRLRARGCIILSSRVTYPTVPLLFALALLTTTGVVRGSVPLLLQPCEFEDPLRVRSVTADCGTLSVPEDPRNPAGRHIDLHVARVPAINRRKLPDPLFIFAGGPGMAATGFYASASFAFDWIHRNRDIVLVDQRGTGKSNPLTCALNDTEL